ncbi:CDP-glycerol glycerophosphotransferase family protein [Aristaeella hokkaidonensis]|uniref:CDP-glycerol glycerophosphotransferase family protein n=1 Tax=Aristaeella hokkaidonensis TaxID=3046382 RepID=UPI00117FA91B|nr:CDP-glycerol glycerophosphotransferase family protein [Aristaeella hokkaidonensis]
MVLLVPEIETAYYIKLKEVKWQRIYSFGEKMFGDEAVRTYNPETGEWLDPETLNLDYVFLMRPFETYLPKMYRASDLRRHAKVCYVTYSFLVTSRPEMEQLEYNTHFIRNVSMIFCEKQGTLEYVNHKFAETICSGDQKAFFCGYPQYDLIAPGKEDSLLWPRQREEGVFRMIWTPRWTTDPKLGGSHFFDYKDQMIGWAEKNASIDLVFRPHPLALANYVSSGLITKKEQEKYLARYTECENAAVDRTTEYYDTFFSSDCLITDISAVMLDYLFTGKPIVYCTSPNDQYFFTPELHECLYKVESFDEIIKVVEHLRTGDDPKKELREKVARILKPEGSAAGSILSEIKKDYNERRHESC